MEKNNAVIDNVVEKTNTDMDAGLIERYLQELPEKILSLGIRILLSVITLMVGLWLIRHFRRFIRRTLDKAGADKGICQFLDSLLKVLLTTLLVLMIGMNFGLDAATVVAALGSVGVAFALALQGSLSNCAGGVLLLLQKIFAVGDYISAGDSEGTVTEIGLFYTRLLTRDGKVVSLPNGSLANNKIINFTRTKDRKLELSLGIAFESSVKSAREIMIAIMDSDERILKEPAPLVFVDNISESRVILTVSCWMENDDFLALKRELLERLLDGLKENDIIIPYPQLVIRNE